MRFGFVLLLFGCGFRAWAADSDLGQVRFNVRCAGCHGENGLGGERAPALGKASRKRLQTTEAIRNIITNGLPDAGMPAFPLPETEMRQLTAFVGSRITSLSQTAVTGDADLGQSFFFGEGKCSECHMVQGRGGVKGPDLTEAARNLTVGEIETSMVRPNERRSAGFEVATVELQSGAKVRGFVRNETPFDMQLLGMDGVFYMLHGDSYRIASRETKSAMPAFHGSAAQQRDLIAFLRSAPERNIDFPPSDPLPQALSWQNLKAPRPGEWPTYNGNLNGNRYSELSQINLRSVANLAPAWSYPLGGGHTLETTPVVANGILYATSVNSVTALDARTGRKIWNYSRPQSKGLVGDAAGGINRGVALLGDFVFLVTDNAHLLALHRVTGGLVWDVQVADSREHYGATSAPLVVGDLIISGVSGGDEGNRGFLAAFRATTGERVWTFKTIPDRSDAEASTWIGRALEHGCGATWLTGTYDAQTDTVFWPIGNPCPDFNGDERKGDNLYTDSVVALDPQTGKRKWHFQFTPHDLHDWDATETLLAVNAPFDGGTRQLLLQGNRNGFFYVLDRAAGRFLRATPLVNQLNWATEIDKAGRPVLTNLNAPTFTGTGVCPSMDGATNWMSSAYHPATGLFYVMTLEKCNVFSKNTEWWKQGESFYGGASRPVTPESSRKFLRAIKIDTGKIAWQQEQTGPGEGWGGLLATAGGLVFSCEEGGLLVARDAKTGTPVWHFSANVSWHASPMTFSVDGKQYLAMAAGSNIMAFALTGNNQ